MIRHLDVLDEEGDVTVWQASLDLPPLSLQRCLEVLSAQERKRMDKFHRPEHRRRYGASQGQLRWLLANYLDHSPHSLQFGRQQWGKPYVKSASLHFNISHSRDCLLIAVSRTSTLGVDVEVIHPLSSMEAMARRCFAAQELAYWSGIAQEDRTGVFFRLWTLKEALMKATGRGLGLGTKRCVFALDPPRLLSLPEEYGKVRDWQIVELLIEGDFKASLCVLGKGARVVQKTLPPDWLTGIDQKRDPGIVKND